MGDITCDLSAEQPEMPSLHRMHQFIADSPRAQVQFFNCLLYTSPSPRDRYISRMPSSA